MIEKVSINERSKGAKERLGSVIGVNENISDSSCNLE